jgi:hypothetical protein
MGMALRAEAVVFDCIPVIMANDIVLPFADAIPWEEIGSSRTQTHGMYMIDQRLNWTAGPVGDLKPW